MEVLDSPQLQVPERIGSDFYYTRMDGDAPVYCRKRDSLDAPEEVLLNQSEFAKEYEYHALNVRAHLCFFDVAVADTLNRP